MSRWFRHYAGMMRDDKLVRIAIKTKQPIERVLWVWGAVLESAAEVDDAGRFDFDADEAAYFLRIKPAAVSSILSALADADHIDGTAVSKWKSRQFQSDRSKERVAAHRAKKRQGNASDGISEASRNGDVTLQQRHGNAPETETETETEEEEKKEHSYECLGKSPDSDQPAAGGGDEVERVNQAPASPDDGLKPAHVAEEWNKLAHTLGKPKVRDLTPARRDLLKHRIAEYGLDDFLTVFAKIERSAFLRGDTDWRGCTFDWVFKKANFQKILEGNYDQ